MSLDKHLFGKTLDKSRPCEEWIFTVSAPKPATNEDYDNLGVAYAICNSRLVRTIDFARIPANEIMIAVVAQGNEAGNGKGLCIYDVTNSQVLAEVTWNGNAVQTHLKGAWTALPSNVIGKEIDINLYGKGSTATEDLDVFQVYFKLRRV